MNDPKMTAEERVAERARTITNADGDECIIVWPWAAIRIAKAHAAAAVAELERERDSAVALANALLLDIGKIAEALGSEASEPAALLADAQALKARIAELERERDEAREEFDHLNAAVQEVSAFEDGLIAALEARIAELEGILHDAPTIDAVESHVPGWLARVRAALGKEAQT